MSTRSLTYLLALASLAASAALIVIMLQQAPPERLWYAITAATAIVLGVATLVANLPSKHGRGKARPRLHEQASR